MIYVENKITVFIVTVFITIASFCPSYGASTPPVGQTNNEIPSSEEGISSEFFGLKGGNLHPFLIFETVFNDNIFSTNSNERDDLITTISPGIWLAFPAERKQLLSLSTDTDAAGGIDLGAAIPESERRLQTYFFYAPSFILYSDMSEHNHINHRAEGLFQYNFNSGLSLGVVDVFQDREEVAGNGVDDTLYNHQENLFKINAAYKKPSKKFNLKFYYSNFNVDYKDTVVAYRDREDNSFGTSAFYQFWPKTSLFVGYNYSDISYDTRKAYDSVETQYYVGINWKATAKTEGTIRVGFQEKDFDLGSIEDQDGFSININTKYRFTPKRTLQVSMYRKYKESSLNYSSGFLSTGINTSYTQKFTTKWSGTLNAYYERNEYFDLNYEEDQYGFGPAIRFAPRKWLLFDLGYNYYTNNSDNNSLEYDTNQIFFRASVAL